MGINTSKSKSLTNIEDALKKLLLAKLSILKNISDGDDFSHSKRSYEMWLTTARREISDYITSDSENEHLKFLTEVQFSLATDFSKLLLLTPGETQNINLDDLHEKMNTLTTYIEKFHQIAKDASLWNQVKIFFKGLASTVLAITSAVIRPSIGFL